MTRIVDSCFLRKTDLRAVQISEGIVEIGESAFAEDGQYSDTTAGFIRIVMKKNTSFTLFDFSKKRADKV